MKTIKEVVKDIEHIPKCSKSGEINYYNLFINYKNKEQMEYFKVEEITTNQVLEVNRSHKDFRFKIIGKRCNTEIWLSPTEAKDLSDFIQKRLSEKNPDEAQPF